MALKRKTSAENSFSMASMTDVIFLLLIFFLVSSTIIVPNIIKVSLPSSDTNQLQDRKPARLIITDRGDFYLAIDKGQEQAYSAEEIEQQLEVYAQTNPSAHIAIYADKSVPYISVVKGINLVNKAQLKVVLATKTISK